MACSTVTFTFTFTLSLQSTAVHYPRFTKWYFIIIIITIIIIIIIALMQGIYNYVPEANHVSRVYNAAALLWLQSILHVMLFPMLNVLHIYISTSRSVCAVTNIVQVLDCHTSRYVVQVFSELF